MSLPAFDINSFRDKFESAARSYLFYVTPTIPGAVIDATYLVKSSSLPSSGFEEITTSMQSLDTKSAGKRTFDNWNVTFFIDRNALLRKYFAWWLNLIVHPASGTHSYPSEYMRDQQVSLVGFQSQQEIMTYTLKNAWPVSVGETALDYSNIDYAQFDVTFAYQYFLTKI